MDGEIGDVKALLLKDTTRIENAFVLDLRSDNMVLFALVEARNALDGEVVRLSSTGGEDNFFGIGVDKLGDFL